MAGRSKNFRRLKKLRMSECMNKNVDLLFWHQGYHPLWICVQRDHC
jgi:hypothetical protein